MYNKTNSDSVKNEVSFEIAKTYLLKKEFAYASKKSNAKIHSFIPIINGANFFNMAFHACNWINLFFNLFGLAFWPN